MAMSAFSSVELFLSLSMISEARCGSTAVSASETPLADLIELTIETTRSTYHYKGAEVSAAGGGRGSDGDVKFLRLSGYQTLWVTSIILRATICSLPKESESNSRSCPSHRS